MEIVIISIFSFCASIYLLVVVAFLHSKYREIDKEKSYDERDIEILKSQVNRLLSSVGMLNEIPINEIMWNLLGKLGYKIEQNYSKFELKKKEDH